MQNKLIAKVMGNEIAGKIIGEVGKFYINHESAILTGGTIGFSAAATFIAAKNGGQITQLVADARYSLSVCNTKQERDDVYRIFLKEMAGLVLPILIFEAASVTCALLSKRNSDKKDRQIAELAGSLSIAQAAVTQYQAFTKEAEKELGEEKYTQIQEEVAKNTEVDGRRFTAIASEGAPGEQLFIDKYSGRPFWCSYDRIKFATDRISMTLEKDNGDYDGVVTINNWYDEIQNPDITRTDLGDRFGYLAKVEKNGVTARFADTHYIFPNGTRIQAAEVYLYPEPDYIG